jgi:quercetin dioxygenase-like cupin family protein
MVAQSAAFMPGMYSLVHHHSGVEAVYVVEGEACFETPTRAAKLHKGETLALPGDTTANIVPNTQPIQIDRLVSFEHFARQ